MADARVRDAMERAQRGERLPRNDRKVPYNGGDGVPIREEIVATHGESVITRNSYGALCLNTPNVLFADVDFAVAPYGGLSCVAASLFAILLACAAFLFKFRPALAIGLIVGGFALLFLTNLMVRIARKRYQEQCEGTAIGRVERFADQNLDWSMRLYRTPAGLRVLVTHKTFDPNDEGVSQLFSEIGVDRIYARMCANQQCFRARLTPKPWRMGIKAHIKPQPGVWPINPDRLPDRNAWLAVYDEQVRSFAACRYLSTLGPGAMDSSVRPVVELHDRISQALTELPIA